MRFNDGIMQIFIQNMGYEKQNINRLPSFRPTIPSPAARAIKSSSLTEMPRELQKIKAPVS